MATPRTTTSASSVDKSAKKVANFKRLASARVTIALKKIQAVGALSNRNSYTYDTVQVSKICTALRIAVEQVEKSFTNPAVAKSAGFEL